MIEKNLIEARGKELMKEFPNKKVLEHYNLRELAQIISEDFL
jgi:hypothetical protein